VIGSQDWDALDDAIDGRVILPSSVEYVAAKNLFKIAARSGGHSYVGASAANGAMVIDLRQLPGGIAYDDARRFATVSAAAEMDSVQTPLATHGRSIPGGRV
jgi:FAD/FMN-containing dehydrogenase